MSFGFLSKASAYDRMHNNEFSWEIPGESWPLRAPGTLARQRHDYLRREQLFCRTVGDPQRATPGQEHIAFVSLCLSFIGRQYVAHLLAGWLAQQTRHAANCQ